MLKKTIILITFLALIYLLIRKIKKKNWKWSIIPLDKDSDFNKIKTIPSKTGIKCQGCLMESDKCCANCSVQEHHLSTNYCQEHNHSHHSHYHHKHTTENNDLISLLFLPILLAIVIYKIIKFLGNYNYDKVLQLIW
ncbi:MAG: hypothetical protein LBR43_02155 [Spiroplasmataceae bacterium]|jgi:hypothetical protein|nr:hypothetical protein [Spiroplasmataceae bacterium]